MTVLTNRGNGSNIDVSDRVQPCAMSRFDGLISEWLWEIDVEGHFIYSNGVLERTIGLPADKILSTQLKDLLDFLPDAQTDSNQSSLKTFLSLNNNFSSVNDFLFSFTADGDQPKTLKLSAKASHDEDGQFSGYIGAGVISASVPAVTSGTIWLRTLEKAVDDAPTGILITDSNGFITYTNAAFTKITGYTASDAVGKTPRILSSGKNSASFYKDFWATIKRGESWYGTVRNRRKNGAIFWCRETVSPVFGDDGTITNFISIQQDVTNEVKASEAQKASEQRFKGFAESASDWYWEMDHELRFSYVSEAACENAGMKTEDMLGMKRSSLVTRDEDRELWKAHLDDLEHHRAFKDFTYGFVRKDGQLRYWTISGTPYYSDQGNFMGYRGVGRDVTEAAILEAQLRQSQKMEVVGQLTGGIAHDFNNLLAVILGNAELLEEMVEANKPPIDIKERLGIIVNAANRGAAITSQLLVYSRKQTLRPEVLDLKAEISGFLDILKSSVGQAVEVGLNADEDLWHTYVDKDQLVNAVLNMSINARDAMGGAGHIDVNLYNTHIETADIELDLDVGDYVVLEVVDDGTGMDLTTIQHVFEPFYSTKEQGRGTGLGLSMVYGFVKKSNGSIRIESKLGEGTCVKLFFPRYTQ